MDRLWQAQTLIRHTGSRKLSDLASCPNVGPKPLARGSQAQPERTHETIDRRDTCGKHTSTYPVCDSRKRRPKLVTPKGQNEGYFRIGHYPLRTPNPVKEGRLISDQGALRRRNVQAQLSRSRPNSFGRWVQRSLRQQDYLLHRSAWNASNRIRRSFVVSEFHEWLRIEL